MTKLFTKGLFAARIGDACPGCRGVMSIAPVDPNLPQRGRESPTFGYKRCGPIKSRQVAYFLTAALVFVCSLLRAGLGGPTACRRGHLCTDHLGRAGYTRPLVCAGHGALRYAQAILGRVA